MNTTNTCVALVPSATTNNNIEDLFNWKRKCCYCNVLNNYVIRPIIHLPKRIAFSFVPPLWTNATHTYIYTDFVGPLLGISMLIWVLHFGYSKKVIARSHEISTMTMITQVCSYYVGMSLFIFISSYVIKANLKLFEVLTTLGYSSYGTVLTLSIPFLIDSNSDWLFLVFLCFTGGLCGIRVLLIFMYALEVPVARLLICSFYGCMHNLFLIYIYYLYMHSTYSFYHYSY